MPSVMRDSKASRGTFAGPTPSLGELPQLLDRIAQYRDEFIVCDEAFRGWILQCLVSSGGAALAGLPRCRAKALLILHALRMPSLGLSA